MSTSAADFSTFDLEDFENLEFRRTYLAHHGATMEPEWDPDGMYTFCWSHGFMQATRMNWGEDLANLWGCVFIFLWKYKKVGLPGVSELVYAYVAQEKRYLDYRRTGHW